MVYTKRKVGEGRERRELVGRCVRWSRVASRGWRTGERWRQVSLIHVAYELDPA